MGFLTDETISRKLTRRPRTWAGRLARRYPFTVTALFSLIGYGLVVGSLTTSALDGLYPSVGLATVNVLSHAIAFVNGGTIVALILGWYWIRQGDLRRHPIAMTTAFALIMVFLVLYLLKTGGGGRKDFVGPPLARYLYLTMLAAHVVLSILSVPLVIYVLVLGLGHSAREIPVTGHAIVGRITVSAWLISLCLGLVTYGLLNFIYSFEFVRV